MKFVWVAIGGALGALGRYLMGGWVYRWFQLGPPFGTLIVNVSGCFLIGLLATVAELKWNLGVGSRSMIFVGFLGSYTTFSTYMFESFTLMDQGRFSLGLGNLLISVLLGFLGLSLGVWLGKVLA